jgi:orotidine-5'-phosphate decarboxylase
MTERVVQKWLQCVRQKKSLLCVGVDPLEVKQDPRVGVNDRAEKIAWMRKLLQAVAPYAAGIKINRQYIRDLSREDVARIVAEAKALDLFVIDDSKIADIGESNDAAVFHSAEEGFDAITYAPFPGNIAEMQKSGDRWNLGIISLVLMSHPAFALMRQFNYEDTSLPRWIAQQTAAVNGAGIVIGAPSPHNTIREKDVEEIHALTPRQLVLVPGIGAQGGSPDPIVRLWRQQTILNVGRGIALAERPGDKAKEWQEICSRYNVFD